MSIVWHLLIVLSLYNNIISDLTTDMSEFSEGLKTITAIAPKVNLEVEYESLEPTHKLWVHLTAGASVSLETYFYRTF